MPTTVEQREQHALCGAKKKNGEPCRNWAGLGTQHLGVGSCKFHFGNAPNHQKHAVKVEAQRRLLAIGEPIPVNPIQALLWTVNLSAGHLEFIRGELAHYDEASGFDKEVMLRVYNDERDRLARTAKLAVDAGVAEKSIRLAETYGGLLARLIQGILTDLALTKAQQARTPEVVRQHLALLDQAPPAAE
jgi:hypothetical protein